MPSQLMQIVFERDAEIRKLKQAIATLEAILIQKEAKITRLTEKLEKPASLTVEG